MEYYAVNTDSYLQHFGVKGMRWGIRRYENADGSLTPAGRRRYGVDSHSEKKYIGERKRAVDQAKAAGGRKSGEYAQAKADLRSAKQHVREQRALRRNINNELTKQTYHEFEYDRLAKNKTDRWADSKRTFDSYDPYGDKTAGKYLFDLALNEIGSRSIGSEHHRVEALKHKAVVDDMVKRLDKRFSEKDDRSNIYYRDDNDFDFELKGTQYKRRK